MLKNEKAERKNIPQIEIRPFFPLAHPRLK